MTAQDSCNQPGGKRPFVTGVMIEGDGLGRHYSRQFQPNRWEVVAKREAYRELQLPQPLHQQKGISKLGMIPSILPSIVCFRGKK